MNIKNILIIIFIFIIYPNIVDSAVDITDNMVHNPNPTSTGTRYLYASGEWYPENQLFMNISGNLSVGNYADINVTTVNGEPVLCAEIYISDKFVGCTDSLGYLNYKLTKTGSYSLTASKSGYLKVVTPIDITGVNNLYIICLDNKNDLDNETKTKNLVLIIDSSGSTAIMNTAELIHRAAKDIINDMVYDNIGIVSFGGTIKTKNISNKYEMENLEGFINDLGPNADGVTDLNLGLIYAQRLLSSVNGKKEIIVISDGGLDQYTENLKKIAIGLQNQGANITYIQILSDNNFGPNSLYENLANSSSNRPLIVLKSTERIGNILNMNPYFDRQDNNYNDKCFVKQGDAVLINVISDDGLSKDAEIYIDQRNIGRIISGKMVYAPTAGIHNITAKIRGYKTGYRTVETITDIHKEPNTATQPIYTVDTIDITETPKEITDKTNKKLPGFSAILTIGIIFALYMLKIQ